MQSIQTVYNDFLKRRSREWHIKANIAGKEYGSDSIVDFNIENSLVSGEEFEIGTAITSKLTITLRTPDEISANAKVVPYLALSIDSMTWETANYAWEEADWPWAGGATEWLPMGEFYIDRREKVNNLWVYTCYDRLMWANVPYVSSLTYPATMQAVWDEICDRLGFTYDSSVVIDPSYTFPVGPAGYTYRQVMGYIAGANAASVCISRDGKIAWKRYTSSVTPAMDMTASDYIRATQTNPIKNYTRVVVVYDPDEGAAYESGIGDENHTLYVENPFATQKIADDLLAALNGFAYIPITMDARGYPQLEAGDVIGYIRNESQAWRDMNVAWEDADIPWDGQVTYQSIILHQKFSFKGGLKMTIEAPSKSEQQSEFQVEGTLTQQVNRLNRNAVKKGKPYFGVTITDDDGLTIERSDHKSKLVLNSDEMDWQVDGVSSLYYDALANKIKFTGTLEGVDGTFSGTVQAGTIIGGTIEGTEITGSLITGGTITGALIQTSVDTYPRIELSSTSQVLKAAGSAGNELNIQADLFGTPGLVFNRGGNIAQLYRTADYLLINTPVGGGDITISSGENLSLAAQEKIQISSGFYLQNVGSIGDGTPSGYTTGALVWGTSKHGTAPHYFKNGRWHAITSLVVDS